MKSYYIFLLLLMPLFAGAQSNLKGFITDMGGQPLDGVTITLSQQNKNIAFALADSGRFILKGTFGGTYVLAATAIGYQPVLREIQLPKDTVLLAMAGDSKMLQGVTVAATKPLIERKIDRVVFNVENSIVASGGSAWDAVVKSPGVSATSDNSLSLNHKGVEVYMDGKPLHLSGEDLTGYLQGLPADLISQIEFFSTPPARFEAQGNAIINIITKKAKKQGLNVTLTGGYIQSTYSNYSGSTTFNYRKGKLNVYGSYAYAHKHVFMDHNPYINYGTTYWDGESRLINESNTHNFRLGADYQLTDHQVLGFLVTGNNRIASSAGFTSNRITSVGKSVLDSTLETATNATSRANSYTYNLNYNLKLNEGKRSLNVDLDYTPYRRNSHSYVNAQVLLPDGSFSSDPYHIYTPASQDLDILSGKMDYSYTLNGIGEFTSGFKYSAIQSKNIFDFYDNAGDTPVLIPENGNHFNYKENTAAVYTSMSGTYGRFTLQAGLRAELTHTRGYSVTLDSLNERHYLKLFPTLYAQYTLNEDNELSINYSYRIERPEYNMLNPARLYFSPYSFYVGNPGLQPAFVHNIELGYTYKKDYNLTAFYNLTHERFSNISVQDNATQKYYDTFDNLGKSLSAGLRFTASMAIAPWWNVSLMAEGYYQQEQSNFQQYIYDIRRWSYDGTLNQTFTISKKGGIKAELNTIYNGPGIQWLYQNSQNGEVDAGIKGTMLKGHGTWKVAVNDIFNTNTYNVKIKYQNQNSGFFHHYESRNVGVTFTYRLGKDVAAARARSTASEEEKSRAQ